MIFENSNDRTDHNRLADQLAERMRAATCEPSAPTLRKPRRSAAPEIVMPAIPQPEARPMPAIEILACEQNSAEWHLARMGIPTASNFDAILTPGKTKAEQKTRRTYMLKLAGEILTGQPMEMVMTRDMERGHLLEPEARDLYTLQTGERPDCVGFIRRGRVGCSPDSLIGSDGGLEIKTKAPHLLIDVILRGEFPEEHKAQVHGALWITGRQWWDLAVYWPGLPLFVKRTTRDEAFIANLACEVDRFNQDLDAVVAQLRSSCAAGIEPEFAVAA